MMGFCWEQTCPLRLSRWGLLPAMSRMEATCLPRPGPQCQAPARCVTDGGLRGRKRSRHPPCGDSLPPPPFGCVSPASLGRRINNQMSALADHLRRLRDTGTQNPGHGGDGGMAAIYGQTQRWVPHPPQRPRGSREAAFLLLSVPPHTPFPRLWSWGAINKPRERASQRINGSAASPHPALPTLPLPRKPARQAPLHGGHLWKWISCLLLSSYFLRDLQRCGLGQLPLLTTFVGSINVPACVPTSARAHLPALCGVANWALLSSLKRCTPTIPLRREKGSPFVLACRHQLRGLLLRRSAKRTRGC